MFRGTINYRGGGKITVEEETGYRVTQRVVDLVRLSLFPVEDWVVESPSGAIYARMKRSGEETFRKG